GTTSLRSAQVYGTLNPDFSPATYATSDLSYSTTFGGGQLSFAYRVSSFFANYAFFEFLVDGSVVLSESGESGWKTFSYSLTAGAHARVLRFRNAIPSAFPCNYPGWSPPAPGGASCADRAWIDALVLPLNVPNLLTVKSRKTHSAGGT